MALAQVGSAANGVTSGESTTVVSASFAAGGGANRCLVAAISIYSGSGTDTIESVVANSGTPQNFTFFARGQSTGTDQKGEFWYLVAPPNETFTVTATLSGGGSRSMTISVTNWTGAHQTTPLRNHNTNSADNTTPTVNITSAPGDIVIDILQYVNATAPNGAGTGQAIQMNLNDAVAGNKRGASSIENGATTVTMSWDLTSTGGTSWYIGGVSLQPAAAGEGQPFHRRFWGIPGHAGYNIGGHH